MADVEGSQWQPRRTRALPSRSSDDSITNQSNIKPCNDQRAHEWERTHLDHEQSTSDIFDMIDKDHETAQARLRR